MSVSAVESTPGLLGSAALATGISGGTGTTGTSSASKTSDKDMFLQLLVAQMKYQDPTNPTDSSEFLSQSAQFTALEKMQSVADQTAQLVALQVAFGASNMVGKTVTYPSADGTIATGVVNSVRFEATGPLLQVNGEDITLATVQSVSDGSAASSAPTKTADGTPGGITV